MGYVIPCGACPYLPNREFHAFQPQEGVHQQEDRLPYRLLMDHRFRRSGPNLYMPMCPGCDACTPIRISIPDFTPRRDQRRCQRRNRDLSITFVPRGIDGERLSLYTAYEAAVHQRTVTEADAEFLISDGGIPGGELHARDASGTLLAVSVIDVFADALSSVYCYYGPTHKDRSLGTFMALAEIAYGASLVMDWLYLGFYVADSSKMRYKARFYPHELLLNQHWQRFTGPSAKDELTETS